MGSAILAALGLGIPITTAAVAYCISEPNGPINALRRKEYVANRQPLPHGLKTAARNTERFFGSMGLQIKAVSGVVGYRTSQMIFSVPASLETAKVTRKARDLEHFLISHGTDMVKHSLIIEISGTMTVTFTHKAMKPVLLSRLLRQHKPKQDSFIIGLDMQDRVARLPINKAAYPHCLIVGSTGSGKSYTGLTIIANALLLGWDIYIFNPKLPPMNPRLGLWDLKDKEGITYVQELPDMVSVAKHLAGSMSVLSKPTILVVDEAAEVIGLLGKSLAEPLGIISQKGREYDCHLVLMVPKATKGILVDDSLHANAGTALIGMRMNSRQLSQWGTGLGGLNLDQLAGEGHAKLKLGNDTLELQIAMPDHIRNIVGPGKNRLPIDTILPITLEWFERMPRGGDVSINSLRRYCSANGKGMAYHLIAEQFSLLVEEGRIKRNGTNRPGVKVQ